MKLNNENAKRVRKISRSLASGRVLGGLLAGLAAASFCGCSGDGVVLDRPRVEQEPWNEPGAMKPRVPISPDPFERDLHEVLKGATKWLVASQGENGGWESDGCGMRDTSLALMSFYGSIIPDDVQIKGYYYLMSRLEAAGMSLVNATAAESKHKDVLPIVAAALSRCCREPKPPDLRRAAICAVKDLLAQCAEGCVADAESMAWAAFCLRHAYWGGLFRSAPELLPEAKTRYGQLEGAWKAILQDEDGYFYGRAKYVAASGWYDCKTGVWHNTRRPLQALHEWRTSQAQKFMAAQRSGSRRVADTALGVLKLGVDIRAIEMSRTWLIDPAPFGDAQPRPGEMADVFEGDVEVQVEF